MVLGVSTWVVVAGAWAGALVIVLIVVALLSRRGDPWHGQLDRRVGTPDRRSGLADRRRGLPDPRELKVERRRGAHDRRSGPHERRSAYA